MQGGTEHDGTFRDHVDEQFQHAYFKYEVSAVEESTENAAVEFTLGVHCAKP